MSNTPRGGLGEVRAHGRPRAAAEDRPEWAARPERSNTLAIRFIVWVALTLGRPAARLLLYPICVYYVIFAAKARAASTKYLSKVLPQKPGFRAWFRHFHIFAGTILDRVFLLNDQFARFDVEVHDEHIVTDILDRGEGCFLIGAHMGSFEIVRSLGRESRGLHVSLLMYEENARKLNSVLGAINPALLLKIIPLGRVDSMLKLEEALDRGEFAGMLADRTIEGEGTIPCRFLGEEAKFAPGPFRIAAMLNRPIVLMFGIYRGGNRYEIYFEKLSDMRQMDRQGSCSVIEQSLQLYVERVEHYCRLAPYNWFNFYDFWK